MNRIRTRFLPAALAAVTLLAGAHSTSAQETATRTAPSPLTLDEAIAIAITNNRDISAASHSVASANLAIATARSYRLPQFSDTSPAPNRIGSIDRSRRRHRSGDARRWRFVPPTSDRTHSSISVRSHP
jgi:outer membrane protein TolC